MKQVDWSKEELTYGDILRPAMEITDSQEAKQFLEAYATYIMGFRNTYEKAVSMAKQNLGYYAGYYDDDVRARVEKLFNTEHPIMGAIAKTGPITPQQAFEMGKNLIKTQKET